MYWIEKQYNGANADICWVGKNQINVNGQARKILPKDPIDRLNVYIQKPFHSMFTLVRKVLDNFVPQNLESYNLIILRLIILGF